MKCNVKFVNIFAGISLASLSGVALADAMEPNLALPSTAAIYTQNSQSYLLALDESGVVIKPASAAMPDSAARLSAQSAEFEPPLLSGSNAHKYMGLATVALVALTAVTAPDEDEGAAGTTGTTSTKSRTTGTHQSLGRLTAAMAAATVTSGLLAHWDDFHLEDGWTDPDNLHALMGTVGALLMLNAVSVAPGGGHAGSGIAGGAAMAVAIKLTW